MLLYRYMAAIVFFLLGMTFQQFQSIQFPFFRYTKYLYPFECTKRNLSNPTELQAAIEGNKREGRRGSYGAYPEMALSGLHPGLPPGHPGLPSQISPMSLVTGPRFNGNGTSQSMPPSELLLSMQDLLFHFKVIDYFSRHQPASSTYSVLVLYVDQIFSWWCGACACIQQMLWCLNLKPRQK